MNTDKQKAIEGAYGEYWEYAKDYVDKNGWCSYKLDDERVLVGGFNINSFTKCEFNNFKQDNANSIFYARPLSLSGIENNHGWIKIESEADLPKDQNGLCWIMLNGKIVISRYCKHHFDCSGAEFGLYHFENITHYQPIIKPQLPIF